MISTLELARLCKISQGTVDRALHNRKGVSQKTRDLVLKVAAKHGYSPHPAAREIITGKSNTVQAVLQVANNIFFMDIIELLSKTLQERNLQLQVTFTHDKKSLLETLKDSAARRHRMAIVIPPDDHIKIPSPITLDMPVISLFSPCSGKNVLFLSPDEKKTGRMGVDYLISQGHRKISYFTYSRKSYAILSRTNGYRSRMNELGLALHVTFQPEKQALEKILKKEHPTAIFCHNDWLAFKTILILREIGVRVPEDISVLGIDNSPTLHSLCPGLTTLNYPAQGIVSSIASLLDGKTPPSISNFTLVKRESVRPIE